MRARQGCSADGAAHFEGGLGRYRLPHETRVPESLPKHPGSGRKENERKENERNERPSPQSTNVEHAPPSNTAADGLGARHPLAAAPSTTRSCPGHLLCSGRRSTDTPLALAACMRDARDSWLAPDLAQPQLASRPFRQFGLPVQHLHYVIATNTCSLVLLRGRCRLPTGEDDSRMP